MVAPVDFVWLEGHVLRPSRATAGAASWPVDPDLRGFRPTVLRACPRCDGEGVVGDYDSDMEWEDRAWTCFECATVGTVIADSPISDHPIGATASVALSSNVDAVLRAEMLARTCLQRLAPWGIRVSGRVIWRVGGPLTKPNRATLPHPRADIIRGLLRRHWRLEYTRSPGTYPRTGLRETFVRRAYFHAELDQCWRLAAERCLVVPASFDDVGTVSLSDRPDVIGRSMAELPNPFAPLVDLWASGYAFDVVTKDTIQLIAPEPADDHLVPGTWRSWLPGRWRKRRKSHPR